MPKPDASNTAGAPSVPRETRYDGADGIVVIWPVSERRGLLRIGDLHPGVEYVVAPAQAVRLVQVKRFRYASAADEKAAAKFAAAPAIADAATDAGEGGGNPVTRDEE